ERLAHTMEKEEPEHDPTAARGGMATLGRGSKSCRRGAEFHEATVSVADAGAIRVGGPFYEDIELGQVFDAAPGLTLTNGHAALRDNRPRSDRQPTGLVVLRIRTVDQRQRPILDFWRCAMLPLREAARAPHHADDLDAVGALDGAFAFDEAVADWDLDVFRAT